MVGSQRTEVARCVLIGRVHRSSNVERHAKQLALIQIELVLITTNTDTIASCQSASRSQIVDPTSDWLSAQLPLDTKTQSLARIETLKWEQPIDQVKIRLA